MSMGKKKKEGLNTFKQQVWGLSNHPRLSPAFLSSNVAIYRPSSVLLWVYLKSYLYSYIRVAGMSLFYAQKICFIIPAESLLNPV